MVGYFSTFIVISSYNLPHRKFVPVRPCHILHNISIASVSLPHQRPGISVGTLVIHLLGHFKRVLSLPSLHCFLMEISVISFSPASLRPLISMTRDKLSYNSTFIVIYYTVFQALSSIFLYYPVA